MFYSELTEAQVTSKNSKFYRMYCEDFAEWHPDDPAVKARHEGYIGLTGKLPVVLGRVSKCGFSKKVVTVFLKVQTQVQEQHLVLEHRLVQEPRPVQKHSLVVQ